MRRTFPLCLAVLLALSPRAARAASPPRTNLVFITSDDHRWDALGAAGNAAIHTPALDRLAARGIYFRQATAHVAQCLPVRGTLLTGLAVHQHGEVSHEHAVPEDGKPDRIHSLPTVPRLLREAGYRTVLIGKWHLAANPWQSGFSEVRSWLPAGGADYQDPLLARGNSRRLRKTKGNTQRIFGDEAVRFVRSAAAREKPFFLWLAFTAPHVPMEPNSAASRRLYADKTPAELRPPGFTGGVASDWRPYYAAISDLDREVGRLQAALEESGLAPSTAVVFLGDNGHMMGQRGIGADGGRGKVVPYEASIRVPLIVAGAQGPAGPSDLPASSLDLPVTLLRLAGIEPPAAWPGRDLLAAPPRSRKRPRGRLHRMGRRKGRPLAAVPPRAHPEPQAHRLEGPGQARRALRPRRRSRRRDESLRPARGRGPPARPRSAPASLDGAHGGSRQAVAEAKRRPYGTSSLGLRNVGRATSPNAAASAKLPTRPPTFSSAQPASLAGSRASRTPSCP